MCAAFFGGYWWIFPLAAFAMCLGFMIVASRVVGAGRGFRCMGGHHAVPGDKPTEPPG